MLHLLFIALSLVGSIIQQCASLTLDVETSEALIDEYSVVSKKGFENSADMRELFLKVPVSDAEARELYSLQNDDGSFKDINYEDGSRGVWAPAQHCFRIQRLAIRYRRTGDAEALGSALRAVRYWCDDTPVCLNWWHNEIGCPRLLAPAFILLKDELTSDELGKCIRVLDVAQICRTGQNRVWLSGIVLMRGLLTDDETLVREACEAIASEIRFGEPGAGVQKDWSFHQHGRQLQFGNYGLSYAVSLSWWAMALKGTPLEFSSGQIAFLKNYIGRGLGQMVYNGMFDHNACGRQIFPNVQRGKALCTALAADNLNMSIPERRGGIYYPQSDYAVYRGDGWYASLRMQSRYVKGYECTNGENTQAYFSSDGALLTRARGDEYDNIADIWNWKHIPGVTSWDDGGPVPATPASGDDDNPVYNDAPHPFCRMYGRDMAVGMLYDRDSLKARKSWFFFPGGVVCLGAGISCSRDVGVVTTVDQRLCGRGGYNYPEYKSLDNTTFCVGGSAPVQDTFIDHGRHPAGASCAYAILYGGRQKISVIENSPSRQAVRIGNKKMEIVW